MANDCIPLYRPGADLTAVASADVTGKRFVDITGPVNAKNGTLMTAAPATAAGKALGVAARDAVSGARFPIILGPGHVVPVTAGGAVTAGDEVEAGTDGKAVKLASGESLGRALSTAVADGDDVFVRLD